MLNVNVTLVRWVLVIGDGMASDNPYFVVSGLPGGIDKFWKHVCKKHEFWESACNEHSITIREPARKQLGDSVWRFDFKGSEKNTRSAFEKIIKTAYSDIKDMRIWHRTVGSGLVEVGHYGSDDEMLLEGAFSDEEREYLPIDQRAEILGIKRQL